MSNVTITRHGAVLHLEMNRPDKKNALTGAMYDTMREALEQADNESNTEEPGINVILLSGAGGCFTAGNDIADFLAYRGSMSDNPASRFIKALARCRTPLVAAVEGLAIGIGTTLLLHCDLVYAAPDTKFKMPFIDLGLVPEAGASLLLPARAGMARASEWLLLGDGFGAEEAKVAGIINAIIEPAQLNTHALAIAQRLAAKPRQALRNARSLMRGDQSALLLHMDTELAAFAAALASPEAKTAFMAFLNKKP